MSLQQIFNFSRRGAIVATALALCSSAALADWPADNRPVKILVPWPTGGATDQVARMLAQPLSQDLIAGYIDMMVDTGSLGSIRGGLLRPLAVAADKRLAALPDVPTFKEAGTAMIASAWYGLMLPANAPTDAVSRLNIEVNKILRSPEIYAKFTAMGAIVMGGSAQEFGRFAASELKRYEVIVRESEAPKE